MAWNNQLSPVPSAPNAPSAPSASDDGIRPQSGAVPSQAPLYSMNIGADGSQYLQNPMYPQQNPQPQHAPMQQYQQVQAPPQMPAQMPQMPQMPNYAPRSAPQATRMPAAGSYDGQAILGAQPGTDSDQPDTHDDIWIDRTKQAIAETQNDPHRQVQLLQHLSVLYLKERFNREVQADKG